MLNAQALEPTCCKQCREPLSPKQKDFCCWGCKTVYQLLDDNSNFELINPSQTLKEDYQFLNDPESNTNYINQSGELRVYVEGIQCTSCLWIIENLPNFSADIHSAELDMSQNIVTIKADNFYKSLQLLAALGYSPRPLKIDDEAQKLLKQSQKKLLYKIAVAAFCGGNIMLLSSSIYFGVEGTLLRIFEVLSLIFAIPIVTYSSTPFYLNLYRSIVLKRASIDAPIVAAIAFGFLLSCWNLLIGSTHHYFDSLSALVFLLLVSRYVLNRTQQGVLKLNLLENFIRDQRLRKYDLKTKKWTWVSKNLVHPSDYVYIKADEKFPVDGQVYNQSIKINPALLTGESLPKTLLQGEFCYAGTKLLSDSAILKVNKMGNETRLGQTLKQVERQLQSKTNLSLKTDIWAQKFTYLILALGALSFIGFSFIDTQIAIERTLALIIIACPCTLAFISPLIQSLSIKWAARSGFLIKSASAFERLEKIKNIVFDKTGTLTKANFKVLSTSRPLTELEQQIIFNLEQKSDHPVARAIVQHLGPQNVIQLIDFQETLGQGVSAVYENNKYEIKKVMSNTHSVGFFKDNQLQLTIELGDELKDNINEQLQWLNSHYALHILSGDRHHIVERLADKLNIPAAHIHANLLPEQKQKIIQSLDHVMMVGDGANDTLALAHSDVSIAVNAAVDSAVQASDIYINNSNLELKNLMTMSKSLAKLIKINLGLSFVYNITLGGLALMGFIHPLFAAIIMPINTMSVLGFNILMFYKWRKAT